MPFTLAYTLRLYLKTDLKSVPVGSKTAPIQVPFESGTDGIVHMKNFDDDIFSRLNHH